MNDKHKAPPIVTITLLRDGCVDTAVDEGRVLEVIALGCHSD